MAIRTPATAATLRSAMARTPMVTLRRRDGAPGLLLVLIRSLFSREDWKRHVYAAVRSLRTPHDPC